MKYTTEEKIFITNKYEISRSPAIVQRAWRTKFISSFAPCHATILRIAKQFEENRFHYQFNTKKKKYQPKKNECKNYSERSDFRKAFTVNQKSMPGR